MKSNMSYLQAIGILECMAIDMINTITDLPPINPMYDVLAQRIDAINLAQKTMREKIEYVSSCEE